MKRVQLVSLVVLVAISAMAVSARAQSTTDTQNVRGEFRASEGISLEADASPVRQLSVGPELVEMPAGHATLIPETGTTAMLLAAGALGAATWLRRRVRSV